MPRNTRTYIVHRSPQHFMKLFHIPQAKLNRMEEIGLVQSTNPSFIWGERLLLVVNGHNVWDCRVQRRNNLVVITASTSRKSNRSNSWELTTSTKKTSLPQESNRRSHGRESTCSSETEGEKSEHRNHQCVENERLSSTTKLSWPQWHSLPRCRSRTIHRTVKTTCFHFGKSSFSFRLLSGPASHTSSRVKFRVMGVVILFL